MKILLVLYLIVNGVAVERGIRSSDGVNYDEFKTMAECQAQAKKDMAEFFKGDEDKVKLVCEKRT